MPLTQFQSEIAQHLAKNRSIDSYLAGGSALHFEPNTERYSNDLDYFHDSAERVASAFEQDRAELTQLGYAVTVEITQPGYIRAQVRKNNDATKIEWAHDSAWRFMPTIHHEKSGYQLHPIDLAINKVLALAGRDESRDFIDTLHVHRKILPLGALCWAAAGKDPGFTPLSLLELLRRRGKYRPEDFDRLMLTKKFSPKDAKKEWFKALEEAEVFIKDRPPSEVGCLYYSIKEKRFIAPHSKKPVDDLNDIALHYGTLGGIIPKV